MNITFKDLFIISCIFITIAFLICYELNVSKTFSQKTETEIKLTSTPRSDRLVYEESDDFRTVMFKEHRYIVWTKRTIFSGQSGITHDPDCPKCRKVEKSNE